MDQQLIPWALYDLSGAHAPDSLVTMQDYFRRFRGLRGKSLEGIAYDALQSSWCAFIRRWNRMLEDGRSLESTAEELPPEGFPFKIYIRDTGMGGSLACGIHCLV